MGNRVAERLKMSSKTSVHKTVRATVLCIALLFIVQCSGYAQEKPDQAQANPGAVLPRPQRLNISEAIELSRRNYPVIRMASLKAQAAGEGITQAKTAYLPRADLMLDENWGTANNITGFLAPQSIVPNISGLVRNKNNFLGGFGFTTGTLISWQPFDFGLRKAQVDVARSAARQAQSQVVVSELDTMGRAADAFLSVLAAQEVLRASQAKVDRMKVFLETVHVLAEKQLRPVTDEYLAQAELVEARDEQIAAEQNTKIAIAALVKWTGIADAGVELDAGPLVNRMPENHFTAADPYLHPRAVAQQAVIDVARGQKRAIERAYFPQFFLRFPIYARGSSFEPNLSLNFGKGYYPTKFNYAVSAYIYFPAMDIFLLRSQRRAAEKNEQAELSRLQEIVLNLKEQDAQARAMIEGAVLIARNAPIKVRAAQEAANSARVRYQYQLSTVNDVAQNEQLLTQSQVDYATAELQVWRAVLAASLAHGDIKPFVDQVAKAAVERK